MNGLSCECANGFSGVHCELLPAMMTGGCDISFLVETSELLGALECEKAFDLVWQIASNLPYVSSIADGSNHLSLAHYSSPDSRTGVSTGFCNSNDPASFRSVIATANASYYQYLGISDIDGGINLERTQIFTPTMCDRPQRQNIVVLLGTGYYDQAQPYCCNSPFADAASLRALPTTIYAVQIGPCIPTGSQQCNQNLVQIVGGNPSQIFSNTSVSALTQQIIQACPIMPITPTPYCDIVIIFDASQSLTTTFATQLAFGVALVQAYGAAVNPSQIVSANWCSLAICV